MLARRRNASWIPALAAALSIAGLAGSAAAAETGSEPQIPLERFTTSFTGDRLFGLPSPFTAGDLTFHGGLVIDYAHNPLVLVRDDADSSRGSIVSNQLFLHLNASLALWNRLTVNVDVPVALFQSGDAPTSRSNGGTTFPSPDTADFGDLRVGVRGTLYGGYFDMFQVGVQANVWVPTGTGNFVTSGGVRVLPELVLGGRGDKFVWSFAAGPEIWGKGTVSYKGLVDQGTMIAFGAGIGILLGEDKHFQIGPEISGALLPSDVSGNTTNLEALLGMRYRFADDFEASLALGPGLAQGVGTPDFRTVVGIAYTPEQLPPVADRDKDKIPDATDACPDVPGVADPDPKKNGCPPDRDGDKIIDDKDACPDVPGLPDPDPKKNGCPPPNDRDKDGIADDKDACPDVPGVAHPDPKKNGCPPDRDNDGIIDAKDACPDEPGVPDPDPKKNGCPLPKDRDKDGILDPVDACPDVPGVADPDPKKNGCPPDRDGDGIIDAVDACPDKWGVADADPKKHGCPKRVVLTDTEVVILQQVQFDFAKATIRSVSNSLLDEVASVLRDHPELTTLEVQGHTDNKGARPYNLNLSQNRANAVMAALVARGIDPSRLTARGYGPDVPIAENTTDAGRQLNRRVQFRITGKDLSKKKSTSSVQ